MRIVIADDDMLVSGALRTILEKDQDIEVQGISSNALIYSLFHSAGFVSHTVKYISHTVVFVFHSVKQRICFHISFFI